jgi:hypothetical protein
MSMDYNRPPSFDTSTKANQFIDIYVLKKIKFLEEHGKMLAPDSFFLLTYVIYFFHIFVQ